MQSQKCSRFPCIVSTRLTKFITPFILFLMLTVNNECPGNIPKENDRDIAWLTGGNSVHGQHSRVWKGHGRTWPSSSERRESSLLDLSSTRQSVLLQQKQLHFLGHMSNASGVWSKWMLSDSLPHRRMCRTWNESLAWWAISVNMYRTCPQWASHCMNC